MTYLLLLLAALAVAAPEAPAVGGADAEADELERLLPAPPRRVVALTFDDGPHPLVTPLLLDILARRRAKATFYVVGQRVRQYPALTRLIHDAGHEIANHTESHRNLLTLSGDEIADELRLAEAAVRDVTGRRMRSFRPPGGRYDRAVVEAASAAGYPMVLWDINTADYSGVSAGEIQRRILARTRPGSIVLMHNGVIETARAMPSVLDELSRRGFECVTVATMRSLRVRPSPAAFARFYRIVSERFGIPIRKLKAMDRGGSDPREVIELCRLSKRAVVPAEELVDAYLNGLSVRVISKSLGESSE